MIMGQNSGLGLNDKEISTVYNLLYSYTKYSMNKYSYLHNLARMFSLGFITIIIIPVNASLISTFARSRMDSADCARQHRHHPHAHWSRCSSSSWSAAAAAAAELDRSKSSTLTPPTCTLFHCPCVIVLKIVRTLGYDPELRIIRTNISRGMNTPYNAFTLEFTCAIAFNWEYLLELLPGRWIRLMGSRK